MAWCCGGPACRVAGTRCSSSIFQFNGRSCGQCTGLAAVYIYVYIRECIKIFRICCRSITFAQADPSINLIDPHAASSRCGSSHGDAAVRLSLAPASRRGASFTRPLSGPPRRTPARRESPGMHRASGASLEAVAAQSQPRSADCSASPARAGRAGAGAGAGGGGCARGDMHSRMRAARAANAHPSAAAARQLTARRGR